METVNVYVGRRTQVSSFDRMQADWLKHQAIKSRISRVKSRLNAKRTVAQYMVKPVATRSISDFLKRNYTVRN